MNAHLFPSFRISVVMGLIIIYNTFSFIYAQMEEACELFYNGELTELNDSVITVPDETVAFSGKIKAAALINITPVYVIINGYSVSNYDTVNCMFKFDSHFPLLGYMTSFEYYISYNIKKDSIVFDDNGIPIDTLIIQADSSTSGEFDVLVEDGASLPTHYPNEFSLICWERELAFYYNSTQVNVVDESMQGLEVRFTYRPGEAENEYTKVYAEISNAEGSKIDKETYSLSKENDSTFSNTFPRVIIVNNDPDQENGTLEHQAPDDSIFAVFRNNEDQQLPLDTLRIAVTFRLKGYIVVQAGYYYDKNADGYVDSIFIKVTTDLAGGLTEDHLQEIMESDLIKLPDFREFSVTGYHLVNDGFALLVEEGNDEPTTYVTDSDSFVVLHKILSVGGWFEAGTVPLYDKVAPIIHWKQKSAYLIEYMVDTIPDTLTVVFSEPIEEITKAVPFYFLDSVNNVIYTAELTAVAYPDEKTVKFVVYWINNNVEYMRDGDSIWIHEDDCVGDICLNESGETVHNYQNNKDNIRRVMRVETILYEVGLNPWAISPVNLSNIDNYVIPDELIAVLDDQGILDNLNLDQNSDGDFVGMMIQVIPDNIDIESMKDLYIEGFLSISSGVSNQLVENMKMAFNNENKTLNWAWNVKDQNGVYVYSGTYLVHFTTKKYPQYTQNPDYVIIEEKRLYVEVTGNDKADDSCGGCGTGTELAFIPPIGFKIASMFKRKKWWYRFLKWLKAKITCS